MRRAAWLLTVACASTARRRLKKTARVPSPTGPVSDDVARLRKTTRTPCDLSIEPEGSLLVFTAQRSGSRWFVDTLGARSGGKITSKMFEMRAKARNKASARGPPPARAEAFAGPSTRAASATGTCRGPRTTR